MASIRKRGENSYLIVVSRGYDYEGTPILQSKIFRCEGVMFKT